MKNSNSHIYLYAKGHYLSKVMMDDLQVILAQRNAVDSVYLQDHDILQIILGITVPFLQKKDAHMLEEFLLRLSPTQNWRYDWKSRGPVPTFEEVLVSRCLLVLQQTEVFDGKGNAIIPLDPPDPLLLPIKFHGQKEGAVDLVRGSLAVIPA